MLAVSLTIFSLGMMGEHARAMEVEGVHVADTVQLEGRTLLLNGAGIRTKFFFDIYIGALYLNNRTTEAEQVINEKGTKRVWMHFLYDEVSKEKLVKGWVSGFENNTKKVDMAALQTRLNKFNGFFSDMKKGDNVVYDFLRSGTTNVTINGKSAGSIEGVDFQQALLTVWLGKKPADSDLKEGMLGE